jgi:hypothetical protein
MKEHSMDKDKKIIAFHNKTKQFENHNNSIKNSNVDYGEIIYEGEYTVYSNKYFDFELKVPEDWSTFGYRDMMVLAEQNIKKLNLDEEKMRQMLEGMSQNLNLFRAAPFPERPRDAEDNPTFTCTANRVVNHPNMKAKDFIEDVKEQLLSGNMGIHYKVIQDIHPVLIGGVRFDMIEVSGLLNNISINSKYYSTIKKGYELIFITSCTTEKGIETLNRIMGSIRFGI